MDKHIGEQYGHFEIVSRDTSKEREYYFLKCLNCGKIQEKSVRYDGIKNNSKGRKCGCDKDLTGKIFGYLQIVALDNIRSTKEKETYYFCKCLKCNRQDIVSIKGSRLKNGNTKSCGCLNDESHRKDIRGQTFGDFIILDVDYQKTYDTNRKSTGTYWKAKCQKCGQERSLIAKDLFQNKIPNCLCSYTNSKGEQKIFNILSQLNISFEQQKTYSELNCNTEGILRFDFFLEKYNILIEYQGIQHYEAIEHFGGTKTFEQQKYRDNLKRQYCKDNNIKLIEIPCWDYNKLNEDYILNLLDSQ